MRQEYSGTHRTKNTWRRPSSDAEVDEKRGVLLIVDAAWGTREEKVIQEKHRPSWHEAWVDGDGARGQKKDKTEGRMHRYRCKNGQDRNQKREVLTQEENVTQSNTDDVR